MDNSSVQGTPQQIIPPLPHSHLFSMVLSGVIMLLVGIIFGYFLFSKPQNEQKPSKKSLVSPTISPTPVDAKENDELVNSIVFLQDTSNYIGDNGTKVFLTQNKIGETLNIVKKDTPLSKAKIIYKFDYPSASGFTKPIYVIKNYIIAPIAGGGGNDILLFNLNGQLITDSLRSSNAELKNWYIGYSGKRISDSIVEINLGKVDNSQATAQIDITTGKMVPGSLVEKAKSFFSDLR